MSVVYVFILVYVGGMCSASPISRIVNGTPTTIEEFPGIVQIEFFDPATKVWFHSCGGNILNELYILSAAHCTDIRVDPTFAIENRRIRAGATLRNTGGVIRNTASILNHLEFFQPNSTSIIDSDICIIRIEERLTYGDTIKSITIPPQGFVIPSNAAVKHVGWGKMGNFLPQPEVLLYVDLVHISNCYIGVGPSWSDLVTENMICAGTGTNTIEGACGGDSGGPLYYVGVVVGLTSWLPDWCDTTAPTVSTRVASFTNWILENTP